MYTGVFRVRVHCRCPSERPCTLYPGVFTARVHGCSRRVRTRYTAVHDPNTAMYMAVYRAHGHLYSLCTRMCTAVNIPGTRPCTGHVPCTRACLRLRPMNTTLFTARVHGPCTQPCSRSVHDGVHGPYTRPCTGCTAVHGHVQGTQPCMRLCTLYTAMLVAHVHSRPRPCTDCVHGMHGPCTWSVHDPKTAVYTAVFTAVYTVVHGVYGPCTPRHNAHQASQKLTTEICWTAIAQIQ